MKILVAEDSKTNLLLITEVLQRLGHEVIAATSGEEAIQAFQQQLPDLIILDVMMGKVDGFETARRIRLIHEKSWVPIIFLSSSVDDESIAQGIAAGGDDYLTKPFSEITLAAKIKAMQRISDIQSELIKLSEKLSVLSSTDSLTGIYNRLHFENAIKEKVAYAKRHSCQLCLLFLDLDNFKAINDNFGHSMGDLLLIEVVKRIKENIREEDFVARLGGDEFAIMIENVQKDASIDELLHKLVRVIGKPYLLAGKTLTIGVSIGCAFYPTNADSKDILVKNSDIAMYHAKKLGKNNFQYFSEDLAQKSVLQFDFANELKKSMTSGTLSINYQPIFEMHSKEIIGVEALMQWDHSELGVLTSDNFILLAEKFGALEALNEWEINNAFKQLAQWRHKGFEKIKLFLNFSSSQLIQKNIIEIITKAINQFSIDPGLIEIELNEGSLNVSGVAKSNIKKLTDLGMNLSIKFGLGCLSLEVVREFPVNLFKIDEYFIHDVIKDESDSIIVQSIVSLGKRLGLKVIAEGVDDEAQLSFLVKHGCEFGQGPLLSFPLSAAMMTDALQKGVVQ